MVSPRRGWLQQEFDQKSGHSRFSSLRLLEQKLSGAVEDEERKGAVEYTVAVVAITLAEVSDLAVGLVNQNEGFFLAGDDLMSLANRCLSQSRPPSPGSRHRASPR